jgi:hypothetical protein
MAWVTFPLIGGETGLVTLLGMDRKRTNVTQSHIGGASRIWMGVFVSSTVLKRLTLL